MSRKVIHLENKTTSEHKLLWLTGSHLEGQRWFSLPWGQEAKFVARLGK